MPPLARLLVKTAFVYFVAGFLLLGLMAVDRWLDVSRWLKAVYTSQLHLLLVGWLSQLAIGVAYWMFPRLRKEQSAHPRGPDGLTWAVYGCLNAGLLLRLAVEPFLLLGGPDWLKALLALAGVLQAAAAVLFAWLVWARIRPMETAP